MKYHGLAINGPQTLFFLIQRSELIEDERRTLKQSYSDAFNRKVF